MSCEYDMGVCGAFVFVCVGMLCCVLMIIDTIWEDGRYFVFWCFGVLFVWVLALRQNINQKLIFPFSPTSIIESAQ